MPSVLDVARSQIGVTESPPRSNRVKYWEWYDKRFQGQPWCACFVSWCFFQAGQPLQITTAKGFIYVPAAVNWAKSRGYWGQEPKPGAIVTYQFDADVFADHTGIVESFNRREVTCIEGNTSKGSGGSQSDGGGVFRRTRPRSVVAGFIYPPHLGVPSMSEQQTVVKGPVVNGLQPWLCHSGLGNQGEGHQDIPGLPKDRIIGHVLNAADPTQDGRKPILEFGFMNFNGFTRAVFEGGIPNGAIDYTVWSVA